MKAGKSSRIWRPAAGVIMVGALAFAVTAQGGPRATGTSRDAQSAKSGAARLVTGPSEPIQRAYTAGSNYTVESRPVTTHPNGAYIGAAAGVYSGNTVTIDGGPARVFVNTWVSGWAPERLTSWQFRVDIMGFSSGSGDPLTRADGSGNAAFADCSAVWGEGDAFADGAGDCPYAWLTKGRPDGIMNTGCAQDQWGVGSLASPNGHNVFGTVDTPYGLCARNDDKPEHYTHSYAVDVPAGAAGTYTIGYVAGETEQYDESGVDQIPLAAEIPVVIEIPIGSCCTNLGQPNAGCEEGHTKASCDALGLTIFRANENCPEDLGGTQPFGGDCAECTPQEVGTNPPSCNDQDACTADLCEADLTCSHTPNPAWNQMTQCCDAATGAICTPTAPNTCTTAACSVVPNRGVCEVTAIADGDPCVGDGDDNPCTFDDTCDANQNCAGTGVNESAIACMEDVDCQNATGLTAPTCVSGFCECSLVPDLTVDITPSGKADDNCFDSGDDGAKVTATVNVAAATAPVNGGQFLITYDPSCLQYNSVVGVAPYVDQVFGPVVDEAAGTIFTVVGVGFGVGDGPAGSASMLELSFTKIGDCNSCQICFDSNNPENTYLVDNTGQRIGVNPVCSKAVIANNEISIDVPGNVKINADCDQNYGTATWDAPAVSDSCGTSTLSCTAEYQDGSDYSAQAMNGGSFPIGATNVCCTASSDWCDKTAEDCWTVEVNDETTLDLKIGLSPTAQSKPGDELTRCIKFTLYTDAVQEPQYFEYDVTFGGLTDFVGRHKGTIKLPGTGDWDCITAWDQLHTLRSCYRFGADDCQDGVWHAEFTGDPTFGGNWLIGGNLDGWKKNVDGSNPSLYTIDILDYGTFASQWGADYGTGDTPCGTAGPNADISGDGVVDMDDYLFIDMNFLSSVKECCGSSLLPAGADVGLTEITVRELRERGLSDLAAGDLNGDGVLNVDDINAFAQGARPQVKGARGVRKNAGTR